MRTSLLSSGVHAMARELDHGEHGPMESPTAEQIASHLVELRRVMGLDVPTLAARARLDAKVVAEIESGARAWDLNELFAIAFGLGVNVSAIFRRYDLPNR
jgi:hypothetical protein